MDLFLFSEKQSPQHGSLQASNEFHNQKLRTINPDV